jgi:hypothetical protein
MAKQVVQSATPAPSFDAYAKSIITAKAAAFKALAKADVAIDVTMQNFIDAWSLAGFDKSRAAVDALGAAIRESETVKSLKDTTWLKRKTFTEYANSAMRAYFHGLPFKQELKNKPDLILPWGKASGGKTGGGKTGGTDVPDAGATSRAELDKTLSKALAQARMLGLTEFAANVLDLCLESLDDFKETE